MTSTQNNDGQAAKTGEWEDMRCVWQALDRRLALDDGKREVELRDLRDRRAGRVRSNLRFLVMDKVLLLPFGVVALVVGVHAWASAQGQWLLSVSGILVHAYGVAVLMGAGSTLALLYRIDYAAPVVNIQRQLLELRRWHVRWSRILGRAWWILWVPVGICIARPHELSRGWLLASIGVGVIGLLVTALFHRWVRHPKRAALAERLQVGEAGRSLHRARLELDELARIERVLDA